MRTCTFTLRDYDGFGHTAQRMTGEIRKGIQQGEISSPRPLSALIRFSIDDLVHVYDPMFEKSISAAIFPSAFLTATH